METRAVNIVQISDVDADLNTDYKCLIGKKINECLHNIRQKDYFVQSTLKYFQYHIHKLKLDRQELFRVYNCLKGVSRYLNKWTDQNYKLDISVLLDVSAYEASSNYGAVKLLVDQMLNPTEGELLTVSVNSNVLIGLFTQHYYVNNTWDVDFSHLEDRRDLTLNVPSMYTLLTDKWIKFRAICQNMFATQIDNMNENVLLMPKHYLNTVSLMMRIETGFRLSSFRIPEAIPRNIHISSWMNDMLDLIYTYKCDIMFLAHQFNESYVPEVDIQFCYLTLYQLSYYDIRLRYLHYDWNSDRYPHISGLLCSHQELMMDMNFIVQLDKSYEMIEHLLPETDYFQLQRYDPIFESLAPLFVYLPDEDIMRHGRDLFLYRAVKAYVWKFSNKLSTIRYIQSGLHYDYHHILREYGPIILRKLMKTNNYIIACPYYNLFKEAKWSEVSSLIFEQQCCSVNARSELLEWLYIFSVLEKDSLVNNILEYGILVDSITFERCTPMTILFRHQIGRIMGGRSYSSIRNLTKVSKTDSLKKFKNQNVLTCMIKPRKVKYEFDTDLIKTKKDKFVILPLFDLEVSNETMFKLIDMYSDTNLFEKMVHVIKIIWSQHVFKEYLSKISKKKQLIPDSITKELNKDRHFVESYIDKEAGKKNLRKTILRMMDRIDKLLEYKPQTTEEAATIPEYKIIRAKLEGKLYSMDEQRRMIDIKRYNISTTLENVDTGEIDKTIDMVKKKLKNKPTIAQCKDYIAILLRSYDEFLTDPVIVEYKKFIQSNTQISDSARVYLSDLLIGYQDRIEALQQKCERKISKLMNLEYEKILRNLRNISTPEQLKRFIIKNYAFIVDHSDVETSVNQMLTKYNMLE